ncbi:hypothetical protein PAUR_a0240 [Pseudoalteromonas aurantia 208]|uniref:Uncharacterized protein n=1 Tax=Pseudoalteromonas aurantia 208 TaxID=1314867 RepID=A0ABR9EB00_9GAMM|nr:hypothetical protein [Pseudoalteromonas aurantia 208]
MLKFNLAKGKRNETEFLYMHYCYYVDTAYRVRRNEYG